MRGLEAQGSRHLRAQANPGPGAGQLRTAWPAPEGPTPHLPSSSTSALGYRHTGGLGTSPLRWEVSFPPWGEQWGAGSRRPGFISWLSPEPAAHCSLCGMIPLLPPGSPLPRHGPRGAMARHQSREARRPQAGGPQPPMWGSWELRSRPARRGGVCASFGEGRVRAAAASAPIPLPRRQWAPHQFPWCLLVTRAQVPPLQLGVPPAAQSWPRARCSLRRTPHPWQLHEPLGWGLRAHGSLTGYHAPPRPRGPALPLERPWHWAREGGQPPGGTSWEPWS